MHYLLRKHFTAMVPIKGEAEKGTGWGRSPKATKQKPVV
jgi:hypothetical protein